MLDSSKTTGFEWWVFKWIFLPLIVALMLAAIVFQSVDFRRCKKACTVEGYEYGNYTPFNRAGIGEKCTCVQVHGEERNLIEINF